MRTISKILLGLAAVLWGFSYTHLGGDVLHGALNPIAFILIIVAFIANFLPDREYQQFEEDQRVRKQLLKRTREKVDSNVLATLDSSTPASSSNRAAYAPPQPPTPPDAGCATRASSSRPAPRRATRRLQSH